MHLSLIKNRPGTNSSELLDFTLARFVRIRLQGMHSALHEETVENNVQWLVDPESLAKQSFYSLRHIKIGARAVCSGHASKAQPSDDDEVCIYF